MEVENLARATKVLERSTNTMLLAEIKHGPMACGLALQRTVTATVRDSTAGPFGSDLHAVLIAIPKMVNDGSQMLYTPGSMHLVKVKYLIERVLLQQPGGVLP